MFRLKPRTVQSDESGVATLNHWVQGASIEATPAQILSLPSLTAVLPERSAIYVPFLPKSAFTETLAACRRLVLDGFMPVPHLPARMAASRDELDGWLGDLAIMGVDRLLLIAGDRDRPLGPFPDTLAVLESGLLVDHGFRAFGIAGHPDGHPHASDRDLQRALNAKQDYARQTNTRLWVVTQFAFDARRILKWLSKQQDHLAPWPVYVGLPGPSRLDTLLAYATQCGVGRSARQILKRPGTARLLASWTPDRVVDPLVRYQSAHPDSPLAGIHLFPFGGLQRTLDWLRERSTQNALTPDSTSQPITQEAEP